MLITRRKQKFYMLMDDTDPMFVDKQGVAWKASTGPRAKGVTVSPDREVLKQIIKQTNCYEERHGYKWRERFGALRIVPVNLLEQWNWK